MSSTDVAAVRRAVLQRRVRLLAAATITYTLISVAVMPFLPWAQRRAGRELGSASAVADSKQTLLCTYLSAAVLVGLVLNTALGWWWADPVVALGLAVVAVREGRQAPRGETCCPPHGPRRRLRD